jgi:hypothetical protein
MVCLFSIADLLAYDSRGAQRSKEGMERPNTVSTLLSLSDEQIAQLIEKSELTEVTSDS